MNAEERAEVIANLNVFGENMNNLYQAERKIWLTVQGKDPPPSRSIVCATSRKRCGCSENNRGNFGGGFTRKKILLL